MPKRLRKKARGLDPNKLAFSIVQKVTGEPPIKKAKEPKKNPAAVALGLLGGAKGGKARAANLSKKELSASARKAAKARWTKRR